MSQIYSQAAWVVLWIGGTSTIVDEVTSCPLSDLGMDFLHDLAVEIAERHNSDQVVHEGMLFREIIKDRRAYQEQGPAAFTPRVRGLWEIFHRSWWGRLWVVQELALSQSPVLMCGRKAESFHNLEVVIKAMVKEYPGQPVDEFEYITNFLATIFHQFYMRNSFNIHGVTRETGRNLLPGEKALDILDATRNTRATDPRDKIYGILGFFGDPEDDSENIFPLPDYTKSAADLYAEVSSAIITSTRRLDVLGTCYGFVQSSIPDLPSWAASWNDSPLKYFSEEAFKAAGNSSVMCEKQTEGIRLLRLKGRKFDSVKLASEFEDGVFRYTNEDCTRLWRDWTDLALSLHSYPTGEDIGHVLMHTLCWGSNAKFARLAPGEYQENFDAWFKILRGKGALDVVAKDIFEHIAAYIYCDRARHVAWGRILCTTTKSYLALVPVSASVGDQIVIFSGGRLPFLLNAVGDKFKLVGPCYVHGIMDGEAFLDDGAESENLEWFTLC
jgi:hypothetical protein